MIIVLLFAILLAVIFPEEARWVAVGTIKFVSAALKFGLAALIVVSILSAGWVLFESYLLPFFTERSRADMLGAVFLIALVFFMLVRPISAALVEDTKDLILRLKGS